MTRLRVVHTTTFRYAGAVTASFNEARLTPVSDHGQTVLTATLSPKIHGIMAWTLLLGFVAFTLVFFWMLAVRMRTAALEERLQGGELDVAMQERWAEGAATGSVGGV